LTTTIECPEASKPATSRDCDKCGKETGSVTCNSSTGEWNEVDWTGASCTGQGVCNPGTTNCNSSTCQCNPGYNWSGAACVASCTFSAWEKVESNETTTCGAIPSEGCVEYQACGDSDKPCSAKTTSVETRDDSCWVGHDNLYYDHCNQYETTPEGSGCGASIATAAAICPSRDICSKIGAGKSCIEQVLSTTYGSYTTHCVFADYSPAGPSNCEECSYHCKAEKTTVSVIQCTEVRYYKRSCN
jgi:hypothetical protein